MSGPVRVERDARQAPSPGKTARGSLPAPPAVPPSGPDRYAGPRTAPVDPGGDLSRVVKTVEARQAALAPGSGQQVETRQAALAPGGAGQQAEPEIRPRDGRDGAEAPYVPPQVSRPVYTGGAPALKPQQMDQAVVKNNLVLRALYALEGKAPWLLEAYRGITKVIGPIGAWVNLGYNVYSARRILADPKAPLFLKGSIAGSTALAGVSAAAATRVGLAAFNVWPMANEGLKFAGKVAGVAGLGAATLLSAMDTFNTFRNPDSTSAQKGFSLLATGASAGLTAAVLLGVTGPVGIGLGIGAIAFTLAKSFLGNNATANAACSAIGQGLGAAGRAVAGGVRKIFSGW